jgi:exodeoxyribonuclease VII large subunit
MDQKLLQSARLKLAVAARKLHGVTIDRARLHWSIGRRMQRVDELDYALRELWRGALTDKRRALERTAARLGQLDVRLKFAAARRRLTASDNAIAQAMRLRLHRARGHCDILAAHLKQLSPLTILERGYAIVEREGKIVKSPEDAPVGSEVRLRLAKGGLGAVITEGGE